MLRSTAIRLFFENDKTTVTGLHGYLQDRGVQTLVMAGLATDYCVAYSALDAARLGYEVQVIMPACRAIDLEGLWPPPHSR